MNRDDAELLALAAIAFLAGDDRHLAGFLSATGLAPGELRQAASEPGFKAGVLEYLLTDESLLLAFAGSHQFAPERVAIAWRLLTDDPARAAESFGQ
ncbi:MAG: DUF3572 family protein [Rhizobiales bacterium]|nr:DUF3572 family protein [Hyphomicrobiales bacterium]